jgi:hypothetical protein
MKPISRFASLITAAVSLVVSAHAQTVSQLQTDGSIQVQYGEPLGQSFTAVNNELTSFEFNMDGNYNPVPNDPLALDILQGSGIGGAVLASSTFSLADGFDDWAGANFNLNVTNGQQYTATLETDTPYWGVNTYDSDSVDPYSGGEGFIQGDLASSFFYSTYADFQFQATFTDGSKVAVPDASSTILMLSSALLGLGVLRRRFAK